MKVTNFLNVIILTLVTCYFTACNNDDDVQKKLNEIKIGGKSFEINNSILLNKGTHNGVTYFTLYLSSSGLTVDASENPKGKGDVLVLKIYADQQTKLTDGTYTVNDQSNNSFIIERGLHFLGFDESIGENQTGKTDIKSGNIIVTSSSNQYTITINLVDENGTNVTGYYQGVIPITAYVP